MTTPWSDGRTALDEPERGRLPWRVLLPRFLVLVPPGQLVGILLGGLLTTAAGVGPSAMSVLLGLSGGVAAGLAVGLFVQAPGNRLRSYLLLCAAFAAATTAVFFVITVALLAGRGAAGPGLPQYLKGILLITVVQTLVAAAVWVARSRR